MMKAIKNLLIILLGIVMMIPVIIYSDDAGLSIIGNWVNVNQPGNRLEFFNNNTVKIINQYVEGKGPPIGKWNISRDNYIIIKWSDDISGLEITYICLIKDNILTIRVEDINMEFHYKKVSP